MASVASGFLQDILNFTTIPLVGTLVGMFMLGLSGVALARRRMASTLEGGDAAIADPVAFTKDYSDWLLGVKAALPDANWNTSDYFYIPMTDEHRERDRAERASASRVYRQTYDEQERLARDEYFKSFRPGVLAIVGEGHEEARNPRSIQDLEAVERLLLAAKPVSPEDARAFKDFAQQFAGWFRGQEIEAPPDMTEVYGANYESEQGRKVANEEISPADYLRSVESFTKRREWSQQLRADYQRDWRAKAVQWVAWARESGAMEREDFMALVLVENPQEDGLRELVETVERMAKRL